jgi:TetR/AcrR family transcriptional repressor of nem operon
MARVREFDTEAALQGAVELFRARGLEGASVQDIVDATGVGRGSLYAAFGSKEGIYRAALERYRATYAGPLVELVASEAPVRTLVREILTGLVDEIVGDAAERSCLIMRSAVEVSGSDANVAAQVRATTRQLEDAFTAAIARGQRTGELDAAADARDLARFIVMTIHGLRVLGAITPDRAALMLTAEVAVAALG